MRTKMQKGGGGRNLSVEHNFQGYLKNDNHLGLVFLIKICHCFLPLIIGSSACMRRPSVIYRFVAVFSIMMSTSVGNINLYCNKRHILIHINPKR